MSRLAKKSINIVSNVDVTLSENILSVKGPKGELKLILHPYINVNIQNNSIKVYSNSNEPKNKTEKSIIGTTVRNIENMIIGVTKGFTKSLELVGVGYKVQLEGKDLKMLLGFSHPITFKSVSGVEFTIDQKNKNIIHVSGIDKQLVGQVAANIRRIKQPEPYKGKGIRYVGEHIIRKSTKSVGK